MKPRLPKLSQQPKIVLAIQLLSILAVGWSAWTVRHESIIAAPLAQLDEPLGTVRAFAPCRIEGWPTGLSRSRPICIPCCGPLSIPSGWYPVSVSYRPTLEMKIGGALGAPSGSIDTWRSAPSRLISTATESEVEGFKLLNKLELLIRYYDGQDPPAIWNRIWSPIVERRRFEVAFARWSHDNKPPTASEIESFAGMIRSIDDSHVFPIPWDRVNGSYTSGSALLFDWGGIAHNLITLFAVGCWLWSGRSLWIANTRRRRAQRACCPECGYATSRLPTNTCPECGTVIPPPTN